MLGQYSNMELHTPPFKCIYNNLLDMYYVLGITIGAGNTKKRKNSGCNGIAIQTAMVEPRELSNTIRLTGVTNKLKGDQSW